MAENTVVAGPSPALGQPVAVSPEVVPAPRPPKRDPNLSRADMEKIIDFGGSVMHKGEIIAHKHLLPDDAELARGDSDRELAALEAIEKQERDLAAAKARLLARPEKADKPADKKPDDKKA